MAVRLYRVGSVPLLLLLSGCGFLLQSEYTAPEVAVPAEWQTASESAGPSIDRWWVEFHDPALDAHVAEALARNNDLAVATLKVRRAQLAAGLAANDFLPVLGATGNASREERFNPQKTKQNGEGGSSSDKIARVTESYSVNGSVSWELDLWGRIARETDAKTWEAKATAEDRDGTALSLVGTVVDLYWQLGYLSERLALSDDSIAYAERTLALVKAQHGAGAASALEELEAQQSLAAQLANRTQLVQQQSEARNALAILFDSPPGTAHAEPTAMPRAALPEVAAGLPAQVLGRRPDLKAAEMRLRRTLAEVDATKAQYLPTLSLTGSLGSSSVALTEILKNPIGTLGAGITLPFLNINSMLLNIKVSKVEYEAAIVNYRQVLYAAFNDVENALSARRQYAEQGDRLAQSLAAARATERIYETRYRAGAVALKPWLDAQQMRRTAEEALSENRYNRPINHTKLCLVLGGGPRIEETSAAVRTTPTPEQR
ncbi:efflux transporter outer membrane subunit [Dongia sp.]|uniref:efflux transporter outer membrane subunit n=1 Tax=Dongia sp. TaxID=1977262 RepID=UPI0035AF0054